MYVFGDEIWRWDPVVVDQARNRTEFYKDICKIVFTSQASHDEDHWFDITETAQKHIWNVRCENPKCRQYIPLRIFQRMEQDERARAGLVFDKRNLPNGARDYDFAARTARFKCCKCGHDHPDIPQTKKSFNQHGKYIIENPNISGVEKTFLWTSLVSGNFGKLAREYVISLNKRDRGNIEALQNFMMQKAVEFWSEDFINETVEIRSGEFGLRDEWDVPHYQIVTIDYQEGAGNDTEHFIMVCRSWAKDRSGWSRLYETKRFDSHQDLRKWQIEQDIHSKNVWIDGGDLLYPKILPIAKQYKWRVLIGDGNKDNYTHFKKRPGGKKIPYMRPYSPTKYADPQKGKRGGRRSYVEYLHWSNWSIKCILNNLRSGIGAKWEKAKDAPEEYDAELDSEHIVTQTNKFTGKKRKVWKQKGSRPNHRWDCENMQVVIALKNGLIEDFDPTEFEAPNESPPAKETPAKSTSTAGDPPKKREKVTRHRLQTPPYKQPDQMNLFG